MPLPTADALAETLRPLTAAPGRAAVLLDVDGTLAPIAAEPEGARVPERTSRLVADLATRYRRVVCVSGRSAAEAKRLVGVGGIAYVGAHGAEVLERGAREPRSVLPGFSAWAGRVQEFTARHQDALRPLGVRSEEKGPIVALHWRTAREEGSARELLEQIAGKAEAAGLATHWGKKVLELRPPVEVSKGDAVKRLLADGAARAALYAGDDVTDIDVFDAFDSLLAEGVLHHAVRVGIRSDEGPAEIASRADVVLDGPEELVRLLETLLDV